MSRPMIIVMLLLASATLLPVGPAVASTAPASATPSSAATPAPTPAPTPTEDSSPLFGDGRADQTEQPTSTVSAEGGTVTVNVGLTAPGTDGTPPTPVAPDPGWPREVTISWTGLDTTEEPACLRTYYRRIVADSEEDAEATRTSISNAAAEVTETYIRTDAFSGLRDCPRPEPTPGTDPTPAIALARDWATGLPPAAPSISGTYAITGNRSWFDLGRPTTVTDTATVVLGGLRVRITLTATATTHIDFGDGTTLTTTSRGGPYRPTAPGPDDITHTYTDRAETNTVTITDTWAITVDAGAAGTHTLDHPMSATSLTFPVREVRSTRND